MGIDLYRQESVFRETIDWASTILSRAMDINLREVLYPKSDSLQDVERQLLQTCMAQPALFAVEYALAKLWMSWGIQPAAMMGHSVGEYVAACLAGVFEPEEALLLVAQRGRLVQAQPSGTMLAVRLSEQDLSTFIKGNLALAAVNSPSLCVISGPEEEIQILEELLEKEGISRRRLHTSHAFHSEMMEPVVPASLGILQPLKLHQPTIPFVSNVTGQWISDAQAQDPQYWASHLRQTVRFADGAAELLRNNYVLLEVGPGQTLMALVRQNAAKGVESIALSSLSRTADDVTGILTALGKLWMLGVKIDWEGFWHGYRRHRVVLPTYPFARKYYWPAPAVEDRQSAATSAHSLHHTPPPNNPSAASPPSESQGETTVAPAEVLMTRKQHLLTVVTDVLKELSGSPILPGDSLTSLPELGFDSLMLTQASQLLQRKFK